MPCARLPGAIIGKKKVILRKSVRLNSEALAPQSFLEPYLVFVVFGTLTTQVIYFPEMHRNCPKSQTDERLFSDHSLLRGQSSKSQNYCQQNTVNKTPI